MAWQDVLENLQNFDLEELSDFNNVGRWPAPVRVIICMLVFTITVGAGYWFYITPLVEDLEIEFAAESELRSSYETKAFSSKNLAAYKAQMLEMEDTFGTLLGQLPSDTEVPGLIEDINDVGIGSGLIFNSIRLSKEQRKEFYVELPILISVKGTYHDLAGFVSGVANLSRIVTLHDFSIKPIGTTGLLQMSITAKTYRYNDKQSKKKTRRRRGR